jgi:hypothetical protein
MDMTKTAANRIDAMMDLTGEMSDRELADAFRIMVERIVDDTVGGRLVKSLLQQELERRNPELRELLETWVEDMETDDTQDAVVLRWLRDVR